MGKSIVSVVKGTNPEKMIADALAYLGGIEAFVKPGATVVVKPNAGHEYPAESSVCTSPAVVAAVIQAIRKANPKEIIVAESAAMGCDTFKCFDVSGIGAAAQAAGVEKIIDIKREKDLVDVLIPDARSDIKSIRLPRFIVDADLVVNVPIFKSHVSMVFTCGLKNIKGVVQDRVHIEMHQTDLAAAMMDLWSVMKNVNLTIADLIRPQEGFGPHCGSPTDFGCIVASRDPVALDATACRMVGLDVNSVDYFRAAIERGVGSFEERDIEIRGNSIAQVYKPLWLPYTHGFGAWPEYNVTLTPGACSSCQSLLAFTFARLQALGQYENNQGINVLLGRGKELPNGIVPNKNLVLMGRCTKNLFRKLDESGADCVFVDGCPPGEPIPYQAIVSREKDMNAKFMRASPAEREVLRQRLEEENVEIIEWVKQRAEEMRRETSLVSWAPWEPHYL